MPILAAALEVVNPALVSSDTDTTDAAFDVWLDTHADEMADDAEQLDSICSGSMPW